MGDITDRDRGITELFDKLRAARGDDDARQKLIDESELDLSDDDKLDLLEGSMDDSYDWDDDESDTSQAAQEMANEDNTPVNVKETDIDSDGDSDEVTITKQDAEDDTYGDDDYDDDDDDIPEGLEDTFDDFDTDSGDVTEDADDMNDTDSVKDEVPHDKELAQQGEDNMIKVGARFGEHLADLSHHQ